MQLPACTNGPQSDGYGFLEVISEISKGGGVLQRFTEYYSGTTWVRSSVNGWNAWKRIDNQIPLIPISVSGSSSYQAVIDNWASLPEAVPFIVYTYGSAGPYTGCAFGNRTESYGHFIYMDYAGCAIYKVQYYNGTANVAVI